MHFAWDRFKDEKLIDKGIDICFDAGLKPDQMVFYILIGFDSTPEEDMYRVMKLKALGCNPYIMPYNKKDISNKCQEIVDTLVMSKLVYPDRAVRDAKNKSIDRDQYGRHSLKSWGQRLGFTKGDYTDFT